MLKLIQTILIFSLFLVSSCKDGRTDDHRLVSLKDVLENPREFAGQRVHLAGYVYQDDFWGSSPRLYIDKEQVENLDNPNLDTPLSLKLLPFDGFDEKILKCTDRTVSVYGVLFLSKDLGLILHLEEGIKEFYGEAAGEFCYKTIDRIPEETIKELMKFYEAASKYRGR
ncbi:hypothetical protein [Kangiella sp.]|uniref:hypothetical protein n=1 Tax=Kangiella sp. TaxID=1920245 RepID=UPI0019CD6E73|nr:hypothetical protein [Kangiella sp.]MBD3654143.1 hypothetical protein [Kangiella sp.]